MKKLQKNNLKSYFFLFILFFSIQSFSQKKITGIVTDGSVNEPLIGGSVQVKGKSTGTITDIEGKFSIAASTSDVLIFSYVGMEKQEITVGNKTQLNVTLQANTTMLSEVVAIGYGSVKKSDLTGSVSVISTKELTKSPSPSAAQALQGKAPGVLVTQSGSPGGGATIRVRGVGSINKSADPIFILDGVQVSDISGIQPHDIENMQVLKDASATAIYGANGSNGVIIITTKRGKSGKPQVNLSAYTGIRMAPKQYDMMNASQYSEFYYKNVYETLGHGLNKTYLDATNKVQANPQYVLSPEFRQKYYGAGWEQGTNWQDQIFKNGLNQNYNLSIAGGGDNSNFNVSLSYTNEDGTVIKNSYERYQIRANSDFKLSKHFKIGENISASYATSENPSVYDGNLWDLKTSPLMKIYNSNFLGGFETYQSSYWEDASGNLTQTGTPPASGLIYSNTMTNDRVNLLAYPMQGQNRGYGFSTSASIYAQIDITDWLMYKITPAADIYYSRNKNWMPKFEGNHGGLANLVESYNESIVLNLENQLLLKKTFNKVHNLQATAVYQIRASQGNSIIGSEKGFNFEQLNTLANGGTDSKSLLGYSSSSRMLSYLGRAMYDYNGKYYATVSYRSDGVSVFAPGANRRGNFASGSLAWKFSEDLLQNVKDIDMMKLRLGWGQTGNSNIGAGFQYYDKITSANEFSPVFGTAQNTVTAQYVLRGFASKDIHWESATMTNLGIDLSMFNSKLQASAEYYIKDNKDLLVSVPISDAFGRLTDGGDAPWYNSGNLQNRGVELSLQWRQQKGDFSYGITASLTTIKNEVKYMPVLNISKGNNITIVGRPIGGLYGYISEGIIQLNEVNYAKDASANWQKDTNGNYVNYLFPKQNGITPQPGDIKYKDLNGDGEINNLDKTIIGKTIPSFTYSFGFEASYKNFDANIFLFGVNGFDVFNAQRASLSSMNSGAKDFNKLNDFAINHWTLENASTTHVRIDPSNINYNDQISSFWIEDGSFLRIKDIQFGYTLASKLCKSLGISSLRLYANGSNLFLITKYKGRDPEGFISGDPLASGTDNGNQPLPKSYTCGLQIGF